MEPFTELLELSKTEKKGLTFYIDGQRIPGIVTKILMGHVEVRNRESDQIVIRLDRVSAVAVN